MQHEANTIVRTGSIPVLTVARHQVKSVEAGNDFQVLVVALDESIHKVIGEDSGPFQLLVEEDGKYEGCKTRYVDVELLTQLRDRTGFYAVMTT